MDLDRIELERGLEHIRRAPAEAGALEMIVVRPAVGERIVLSEAILDSGHGVVGDSWKDRGSAGTEDGRAHPDMQLNVMNARVVDLIAGDRDRWPLAGDQLYVDLDLSEANLPPWTRVAVGDTVIEVTDRPHRGCNKFSERFGVEALRWVNSEEGRALRLRGLNARVVEGGPIHAGDAVRRLG